MTTTAPYVTLHEQRVRLTDEAAVSLAKHALSALDHIPEKVR